eukprot:13751684-Alexandrium_andersonii.AAC.1
MCLCAGVAAPAIAAETRVDDHGDLGIVVIVDIAIRFDVDCGIAGGAGASATLWEHEVRDGHFEHIAIAQGLWLNGVGCTIG